MVLATNFWLWLNGWYFGLITHVLTSDRFRLKMLGFHRWSAVTLITLWYTPPKFYQFLAGAVTLSLVSGLMCLHQCLSSNWVLVWSAWCVTSHHTRRYSLLDCTTLSRHHRHRQSVLGPLKTRYFSGCSIPYYRDGNGSFKNGKAYQNLSKPYWV